MGRVERRIMGAIEACRTAVLGGHVEACDNCAHGRVAYNSCRNRHCPKCQGLARAEWLADRQADLLDVPYFHVVFTMPAEVAAIAFHNKALVYAMLFRAAAETLRTIAADPRHLGAEIGFIAILHTWGQTLTHHPHLHCVVPGGGLAPARCDEDGERWIACRPNFFLPNAAGRQAPCRAPRTAERTIFGAGGTGQARHRAAAPLRSGPNTRSHRLSAVDPPCPLTVRDRRRDTIPIAQSRHPGSVQSGFNEVAPEPGPTVSAARPHRTLQIPKLALM